MKFDTNNFITNISHAYQNLLLYTKKELIGHDFFDYQKPFINKTLKENIFLHIKEKNGTGLGLYMTKTIIEEHLKGKITITSSSGETKVLVELPHNIKKPKRRLIESNMSSLSKR